MPLTDRLTRPIKKKQNCEHVALIQDVTPSSPDSCNQCLQMGDTWVHLRICLICGEVGCCDNSKNKHATKHFHATGHPIIQSFEPREKWRYCYSDEAMILPGVAFRS